MDELSQKRLDKKLKEVRAERYEIQDIARHALPKERVAKCLRMLNNGTHVELWQHLKTQKVFYNGLIVCGSVWHCPVCAAKISERRKLELKQAFDLHKQEGKHIALLTLTFSHKKHDDLADIVKRFGQAVQHFYRSRAVKNMREDADLLGKIGALEVTHSFANSWHPHRHDVLFMNNKVHLGELEDRLYSQWKESLKKVGLSCNKEHGLKLQSGEDANKYIAKHGTWSLEQEMSKAHIKKGKLGSLTPFDLLRQFNETGEAVYFKLFQEYAKVFKGRMQLHWSKGLKRHFIIEDKSDEQLAKEKEEDAKYLGSILREYWKLILKYNKRVEVQEMVEKYGYEEGLMRVISEIEQKEKNFCPSTEVSQT